MNQELFNTIDKELSDGLMEMNLVLNETQKQQLLAYLFEFEKWNKAYNLSAIRDINEMLVKHLFDSLSLVPWLENKEIIKRIIDVGTGGGLPGIPLAIVFPDKEFTLLDSNGKKTRFLFHIKTQLKLDNVSVENCRVEEYKPVIPFDAVVSRAFASLQDMTESCGHLLKDTGIFMAMKGLFPAEEITAVNEKNKLLDTIKLSVAKLDAERHLLLLQPKQ
jgi:16S rRNA (guanine527-N7)-methyltransferase